MFFERPPLVSDSEPEEDDGERKEEEEEKGIEESHKREAIGDVDHDDTSPAKRPALDTENCNPDNRQSEVPELPSRRLQRKDRHLIDVSNYFLEQSLQVAANATLVNDTPSPTVVTQFFSPGQVS